MLDKFTGAVQSGWIKADDVIAYEYWTYDDVLLFVEGDDYYGEIKADFAREVWAEVTNKLSKFDGIDNDMVRDTISSVLDERMGVE